MTSIADKIELIKILEEEVQFFFQEIAKVYKEKSGYFKEQTSCTSGRFESFSTIEYKYDSHYSVDDIIQINLFGAYGEYYIFEVDKNIINYNVYSNDWYNCIDKIINLENESIRKQKEQENAAIVAHEQKLLETLKQKYESS